MWLYSEFSTMYVKTPRIAGSGLCAPTLDGFSRASGFLFGLEVLRSARIRQKTTRPKRKEGRARYRLTSANSPHLNLADTL
jgi:hypothetical protein